jgi:hypothetical protein
MRLEHVANKVISVSPSHTTWNRIIWKECPSEVLLPKFTHRIILQIRIVPRGPNVRSDSLPGTTTEVWTEALLINEATTSMGRDAGPSRVRPEDDQRRQLRLRLQQQGRQSRSSQSPVRELVWTEEVLGIAILPVQ